MQLLWAWGGWEAADGRDRFYAIQDRVKTFYMKEAEKCMVEMGARRRLLEERPSKYFFATVKKQQQRKVIEGLRAENGYVTATAEILRTVEGFYKPLFSPRGFGGLTI